MARLRPALVVATSAVLATIPACGDDAAGSASNAAPTPNQTSTTDLKAAECTAVPTAGEIVRSGYGLDYSDGDMKVSVTPADGAARCVEFAKSGGRDPNVPPDALLFTFAGDRGEGGQLEFLAVDLAGGVLPWPRGATARIPGSPITSTVGVSLDGTYYTSSTCTLKLQTVTARKAAGRFECPQAIAQTANPLDPNDDVLYDDDQPAPATPPKTAALSGLFEVQQ